MTLVGLALLTAVVLAVIFRGRPSTFSRPTVRRFGLLGIALVGMFTSLLAKSPGVAVGWLVVTALALVWFVAVNRGRPGLGLVLLGLALNAVVIVLNSGMPVSAEAIERAGVPPSRVPVDAEAWAESRPFSDPVRVELTNRTVLPWLGEVVPLALPLRPAVASIGDVLMAAGGALFVFTGMTGFGRTVPERLLTPKEKRKERKARKAAKAAEAKALAEGGDVAVVGTAGLGFADAAMHDRAEEDDDLEPQPAPTAVPTVAMAPPASLSPAPPSMVDDDDEDDDDEDGDESTGPAIDPAAAAAQAAVAAASAEKKKIKRQLKKVKKQERLRQEEAAALLEGTTPAATGEPDDATAPTQPWEPAPAAIPEPIPEPIPDPIAAPAPDQAPYQLPYQPPAELPEPPADHTDDRPQPLPDDNVLPPAHLSVGAARGRTAARGRRAKRVNGADEPTADRPADALDDQTQTPAGATTSADRPPA